MLSTKTLSLPNKIRERSFPLPRLGAVLAFLPLAWQLLCFVTPIGFLFMNAFRSETSWTLAHFSSLFEFPIFSLLMHSLLLSTTTAILCLVIGFVIAYTLAFTIKRGRMFFLFLMFLPLWTNFLLHVCSWLLLFNKQGVLYSLLHHLPFINSSLIHSRLSIIVMMIYFYLPFTIIVLYNSLEKIPLKLIDAAQDLGAGLHKRLKSVIFPLLSDAIQTAFFLVFLPSFGEFVIPELMGGEKFEFIGNLLTSLLTTESTIPIGCALAILSMLFLIITSVGMHKILKKLFPKEVSCAQ